MKSPITQSPNHKCGHASMRAVVQRVTSARVIVDDRVVGEIGTGLLALIGVEKGDQSRDVEYTAAKIRDLRIFADPSTSLGASAHMNHSVIDVGGSVLVVSQFTLAGD